MERPPQTLGGTHIPREVATGGEDLPSRAPRDGRGENKPDVLPQGKEGVLAERGLRLVPSLWHGGPSASACLGDKGARWAGSTWAWLWQGRGQQEQAPSGLKTEAQRSCPPTCPRCAHTPPQLDGWSSECGRGGGLGRVGGWVPVAPRPS